MSLSAGTRIGPYEVQAPLGAGGMGEVYRARDTKLARDVALKILPAEFALDPDRLARFTREAQLLAALNHQNIAGIYGFEEGPPEAGHYTHALVLEFVDGPTLADRIAQGPIPVDDALPIARQIAEALEAAHEQGIVHRDLKPANIKVRPDGTVKVLDFGLAKLAQGPGPRPQASVAGLTVAATITTPAITQVGMIMGTAAYMSPEQAKGREADKRSDIWALGCVLFEMLTGTRTFAGDDVSDTLAAVLRADPDWSALPSSTPRPIRTLLRRCLEKDRKRRLADAADARLEIEEALATPRGEPSEGAHLPVDPPLWGSVFVSAGALVLGGLIVGLWMWSQRPSAARADITKFAIPLEGHRLYETGSRPLAISPDGRYVVFAADRRLHVRSLGDLTATPLTGTEVVVGQIASPVFSPDSRSVAYMGGRPAGLKRIAVTGGAPITLCDACGMVGTMSWDREGIVFVQIAQTQERLSFPARGGSRRTSLIIDPPDGRIPPLTPEAQQRLDAQAAAARDEQLGRVRADSPQQRSLADRCILGFNAGPPMTPGAYNNHVQIVQAPGYVTLVVEMVHDARIVPITGRPHLRSGLRQYKGDSIGRWEGRTLVIDTTNFLRETSFRGSSANLHLIERLTRVDADTLLYEFTVDDPKTWTKPWTAAVPMKRVQTPIYEYACHEGNYALRNILSGARAAER